MKLIQPEFNFQIALNRLLIGISISWVSTASVGAFATTINSVEVEVNSLLNTAETTLLRDHPLLLAKLRNHCKSNESLFLSAETRGFWVNICGGDLPHTYVGVSKTDGSRIRLPLDNYEPDGSWYEAINGDVSYAIIFGTTKGHFLSVTQGNTELVKQPILKWE